MSALRLFFLAGTIAALPFAATPAAAQQNVVERLHTSGAIMGLDQIIARLKPTAPGTFIGADFDEFNLLYRLRYMRDGNVVNVIVDARSGQVVGRRSY